MAYLQFILTVIAATLLYQAFTSQPCGHLGHRCFVTLDQELINVRSQYGSVVDVREIKD